MNFFPDELAYQFPSTHWSWVDAANDQGENGAEALGRLLKHYEYALRKYLMERFRCDEDEAKDFFQGFVLDIVLENRIMAQAKPMDGHLFRSFILRALNNYVQSQRRKRFARKRQPPGGFCSLDEAAGEFDPSLPTLSYNFDLHWARGVMKQALERMESECFNSGREAVWGVFEYRLRRPILEGADLAPYGELVQRFGFRSPAQAQNTLATAKRIFTRTLRAVVAEYAKSETAIEVELRELHLILGNCREASPLESCRHRAGERCASSMQD